VAKQIKKGDGSFGFFKQEIESEGVRVMGAEEVLDPDPNYSGSLNLDLDLFVPFPAGRITEVFGQEGTCKTTLVLEVLGRAIMAGKKCLYVNMEKNLNRSLMQTIRSLRPILDDVIDQTEDCPLWIVNPRNGEQAFQAMRRFAEMQPGGLAVLDSIDAALPEAVLSGDIGDQKVGNLAKLMSDAMRKLIGVSEENKVTLIFVNQIRDKISMYGDPTETSGGRAMKFYASQRIQLMKPRKTDIIEDADKEKIGVIIRYRVVKNKVAPDGNEGAFPILFKNGIFREQEIISHAATFGILKMGGKGNKQVYVPSLNKDGEYVMDGDTRKETCMSQFNAARRLLLSPKLSTKLEIELRDAMRGSAYHAVDALLDNEVSDTE
jgi:recombination protein RecA